MWRDNLKILFKQAKKTSPKNPYTALAADIGTCERSVKRWMNGETKPIWRYQLKMKQLVEAEDARRVREDEEAVYERGHE